ncbi:P-loop containing nucleoside triphosphate hydrolase protein [Massariosphaeria phaeospora]|uniref:P-loop containing nucleoside triphosphate hydrolase protein n=1 Tax=Massariosphaeria phaeospora TaxID=100035 RepID=A0A7C8I4H9_9PLEO|nr:P-loop containing nucleoside triphosphate hydrolase protein [Massariosphaeria phaeospora]
MAPPIEIFAANRQHGADVFDDFKMHTRGTRIDTKTTVLSLIRQMYPEHHVTEVAENKVSLFDFASAGKASCLLDADDEAFNATRTWASVGERVEKKLSPGKLDDEFRFARFQYIWEDKEFLAYFVVWKDMLDSQQRMFYILHPRTTDNIVDGHCRDTDALVLAAGKWTSLLHDEIWVFDDGRWTKSKDLYKAVHGASWDDVVLDPDMKKNLIEDVQGFFDNRELYAQFAVPWKRGIILHGVPGNGKTVSIKALTSSLYNRPDAIASLYVKSFSTSCQTQQYSIRQIFVKARAAAPCLLIFEDLDSLVGDDIRSYFLNEVDGLESNDGILMIGSTNHLDRLDPAIAKRPSRFDRKYHYKLPGQAERTAYAAYWRAKLLQNEVVEFPEALCGVIGQLTKGFSFAYLKELFVMALLSLVRGFKGDDFEMVQVEDAAASRPASPPEPSSTADTCSCAQTCNACGKLVEAAQKQRADEAAAAAKLEAEAERLVVPMVEVPEALAENTLLKVVRYQIRVLQEEMESAREKEREMAKEKVGGKKAGGKK